MANVGQCEAIVEEVRGLVEKLPDSNPDRARCLEKAGRLVHAAIDAGAYEHVRYLGLRAIFERARKTDAEKAYEHAYIGAFADAVKWFAAELPKSLRPSFFPVRYGSTDLKSGNVAPGYCETNIRALTELIEREAQRLGTKPQAAGAESRATPGDAIDKVAYALGIFFREPDITVKELARRVGVTTSTLHDRRGKWKQVAQFLADRHIRDRSIAPKGSKTAEGDIEAGMEHWEYHPTDSEDH